MKNKVLVVGGAGYIGGYLTDLLSVNSKRFDVTVYDSLLYETRYLKDVKFIYGDIRNTELLGSIIDNYDTVIWLAALDGDPACKINPELTKQINTDTVKWLVNNFNGKIVFTSTCSVYGKQDGILTEESPTNPLSEYAETKYEAEQYIVNNSDNYLIFRLGTLFGVGDAHSRIRLDLVVNALTLRATDGLPLIVNSGEQWRPLLHVKDVGEAILYGLLNNITGLYNLSYKNLKIYEIADEIKNILPDIVVEHKELSFEDLRNYRVSSVKYNDLGWKPFFSLKRGIQEINNILLHKRIKNPSDSIYINAKYLSQESNLK